MPVCVAAAAVRSYRTVSPLPDRRACAGPSTVCFLLPCSACCHGWPLAITLPYGVRTFLALFARSRRGRGCLACFARTDFITVRARKPVRLNAARDPGRSSALGAPQPETRAYRRRTQASPICGAPARDAHHRQRREMTAVQRIGDRAAPRRRIASSQRPLGAPRPNRRPALDDPRVRRAPPCTARPAFPAAHGRSSSTSQCARPRHRARLDEQRVPVETPQRRAQAPDPRTDEQHRVLVEQGSASRTAAAGRADALRVDGRRLPCVERRLDARKCSQIAR